MRIRILRSKRPRMQRRAALALAALLLVALLLLQSASASVSAPVAQQPGVNGSPRPPSTKPAATAAGSSSSYSLAEGSRLPWTAARKATLRAEVRSMFSWAFEGYLSHAFPHDELKPLSGSWTDSLAEMGNAAESATAVREALERKRRTQGSNVASLGIDPSKPYQGMALTLIDSLSTLAVLDDGPRFCAGIDWLARHLSFDVDLRVNLFELNIRVLGGLLSAHLLAIDPERRRVLIEGVEFVPLDAPPAKAGAKARKLARC